MQFSTTALTPIEQFDGFCSVIRKSVASVVPSRRSQGGFAGALKQRQIAGTSYTEILCDPLIVRRTRAQIESEPDDSYNVLIQLSGKTVVEHRLRKLVLEPGDLTVLDNLEPYALISPGPIHRLLLTVDRATFASNFGAANRIPGGHFTTNCGTGVPAIRLFNLLMCSRKRHVIDAESEFGAQILDLLGATVQAGSAIKKRDRDSPGSTLLARMKGFVSENLSSTELTPSAIAAAHGISTRYVHKVFSSSGRSVCGWIRQRRLSDCYLDLCDPRRRDVSITEIAMSRGFNDASHFSRTFTDCFGRTPRSVRLHWNRATEAAAEANR